MNNFHLSIFRQCKRNAAEAQYATSHLIFQTIIVRLSQILNHAKKKIDDSLRDLFSIYLK